MSCPILRFSLIFQQEIWIWCYQVYLTISFGGGLRIYSTRLGLSLGLCGWMSLVMNLSTVGLQLTWSKSPYQKSFKLGDFSWTFYAWNQVGLSFLYHFKFLHSSGRMFKCKIKSWHLHLNVSSHLIDVTPIHVSGSF